ncbi:MAG: hypothetical protein SFU98_22825 [Leptospiraceae bacterium]|nr:hypothetical protein [Leptospiraceae bacterium]
MKEKNKKQRDALSLFFELTNNDLDSLVYLNLYRQKKPGEFSIFYLESSLVSEMGENFLFNLKILEKLKLFPLICLDESSFDYMKFFYKKLINLKDAFHISSVSVDVINKKKINSIFKSFEKERIPFYVHKDTEDWLQVVQEFSEKLQTEKLLYLTDSSYFQHKDSNLPISIINLQKEKMEILENTDISLFEKDLLNSFQLLLENEKANLKSISITSTFSMFKELFTVKGSGTLIKRGSAIKEILTSNELDTERLRALLEISFRKKIKENFINSKFFSILLEENYRGAGIIKETKLGIFLSKFAVDEVARGEGIGRDIWEKMREKFPKIFWRSKKENPITKWYMKESDGMFKSGKWIIFWIGISPNELPNIIDYVSNLEEDFET